MCGIAGAVSNLVASDELQRRVVVMQDRLRHRGPDGHGVVSFDQPAVTLAHTRLAIIDLSDDAHQPMRSTDPRFTITYNGEIYNYRELRAELVDQGEHFDSHSDTEVILKLFARDGFTCVKHLRGMFAFFIWDSATQTGFAARDPLGIKPLYYYSSEAGFAFASEVRALFASGFVSSDLSAVGVATYLRNGSISEPHTYLAEVQQLGAGHYLQWRNDLCTVTQYDKIEFTPQAIALDQAVTITRQALQDSVRAHLVSDVPVGIFLSGGVDSSALLALASQIGERPINTFSIAFHEADCNEGDIARRVAEHFGANHTEWLMTPEIAKSLFERYLAAVDQPSIDGFNTFCVAKLASDAGQKVVLSGVGGDELFGGYKSFQNLPRMTLASRSLRWFAPLFRRVNKLTALPASHRLRRSLDFLSRPNNLGAAYQALRGIFSATETTALLPHIGLSASAGDMQLSDEGTDLDRISAAEISRYMRNQLLRDSDVMSMAWGLELRVPFADKTLLDAIAPIPAEIRLRQGKQLLKDAVPEIPDWVSCRPKQGFVFPFDAWFSDQWQQLPDTIDVPRWIKLEPWYRRWSLVLLQHVRRQIA